MNLEKVITLAVMGGWDSDGTGATAGSIIGAMLGAKRCVEIVTNVKPWE